MRLHSGFNWKARVIGPGDPKRSRKEGHSMTLIMRFVTFYITIEIKISPRKRR